jgi:hypothetical protein
MVLEYRAERALRGVRIRGGAFVRQRDVAEAVQAPFQERQRLSR